ncbi:glycosyltransferase family 2 protein [Bosea sp. (in: a-proteobacteria)]|uniref:glycosyltransferase family 2 protein n=1 Tax=Bosea sp. (in: a-proteobacteria) TaxID=1871050 RepID=UPI002735E26D|nr:glycosyltransferase [Bosea sp. (in: a-proteobacteria)]MDP3255225.1 glycosyltransferase [Bosea sp. (in: a-proteobacteria)]
MEAPPAPTRPNALADAIARLDWREGRHRRSLAEEAAGALQRNAPAVAWVLADRLVRLSHGRSAIPHILRASALAQLGAAEEASADLQRALAIDPHHLLLQQALLDIGAAEDRRRSAAVLLAMPEGLGQTQALSTMAAEGVALIIHAGCDAEQVTAHLRWRGDPRMTVRASDGTRSFDLEVVGTFEGGHPVFPLAATISLSWPSHSEALSLRPAQGGVPFLAVPAILHRPLAMPRAPRARLPDVPAGSLLIVVPVHDDLVATEACLDSLAAAQGGRADWRVVVVEDAAPDPAMAPMLAERARRGEFTLLRNPLNLGFARSVNRALAMRQPAEDALLLNADTVLPSGAVDRLAAAVHSEASIGTATPLSNNGEDTSFPRRFAVNPMPETGEIERLDRLAQQANAGSRVEMPNGVGFCLYVKGALLDRIGPLSLDYGRGYYEDVDLCLRGTEAGFRHVCAADVFVGHSGTRSFKGAKAALVRANLALLEERFPAHRDRALAFHRVDPLKPVARALEALWLQEAPEALALVVAPAAMPLWLVRLLTNIHAPRRQAVIARAEEKAEGRVITLTAAGSGIPQSLEIAVAPDDGSAPDHIAAELARYRFDGVLMIDPVDVDPLLAAACARLPIGQSLALASAFGFAGAWRPDAARADPVIVPGPLAQEIAAALGWSGLKGPSRASAPPVPEPAASAAAANCLAILSESAAAEDWRLAQAVARALSQRCGDAAVAFVGEPGASEPPARALFPSGPMPRAEATRWLARVGARACLVASRAYGIADPRVHAWARAGLLMAWFDPRPQRPETEGNRLLLPLGMTDDEAAFVVADWFGRLRPEPQVSQQAP